MQDTLHRLAADALNVLLGAQAQSFALDCYTSNPRTMHWCALADITGAFGGQGMFGLFLAGLTFVVGYYSSDGDLVTPSIVLLLLGGILVPSLPSQYQTLALTLMFAGGVVAVMQLLGKYVFAASVR